MIISNIKVINILIILVYLIVVFDAIKIINCFDQNLWKLLKFRFKYYFLPFFLLKRSFKVIKTNFIIFPTLILTLVLFKSFSLLLLLLIIWFWMLVLQIYLSFFRDIYAFICLVVTYLVHDKFIFLVIVALFIIGVILYLICYFNTKLFCWVKRKCNFLQYFTLNSNWQKYLLIIPLLSINYMVKLYLHQHYVLMFAIAFIEYEVINFDIRTDKVVKKYYNQIWALLNLVKFKQTLKPLSNHFIILLLKNNISFYFIVVTIVSLFDYHLNITNIFIIMYCCIYCIYIYWMCLYNYIFGKILQTSIILQEKMFSSLILVLCFFPMLNLTTTIWSNQINQLNTIGYLIWMLGCICYITISFRKWVENVE